MRLTETHRPADHDANGCALSDADLAILAARPERYEEYAADVRREYAHVPDEAFRAGRSAILRDLLAKPHLFHTAYAREHWEAPARGNVERELARSGPDRRESAPFAPQSPPSRRQLPGSSANSADSAADHGQTAPTRCAQPRPLRRRSPAACSRRTSSRDVTCSAPAAMTWSYHSDGTS